MIWLETFEEVESGGKFLESYFIPPDRREGNGPTSLQSNNVETCELVRTCVWRGPLSAPAREDWSLALEEGRSAVARWNAKFEGAEPVLDTRPCFSLDSEGMPTEIELQLRSYPPKPPEGWTERPAVSALRVVGSGLPSLRPASLKKMLARIPTPWFSSRWLAQGSHRS